MPTPNVFYSSPLLGMAVTLGNLAVWLGLLCAVLCVLFYWGSMLRALRQARAARSDAAADGHESGNGNGGGNGKKSGKAARAAGAAAREAEEKAERLALWGR
ncbi:MAG TPA: hypothetical protein VFU47_17945, partial [Armatimonadota bacterium]|nr:hypothetical protein [Armatimonadota bacterium]